MSLVLSVVSLLLTVGALVDIIVKPTDEVKHLPKLVWVLLVVFLPLIGSVIWFAVGHEYAPRPARRPSSRKNMAPMPPLPIRLSTEEQIAELDREIEYYQKRAQLKALEEGRTPLAIEAGGDAAESADAETDGIPEFGLNTTSEPPHDILPERRATDPEV